MSYQKEIEGRSAEGAALCRSARCPRFPSIPRRRRRQKRTFKSPWEGAHMQDQKSEGRHRFAAGEIITGLAPEGQPTAASPSTPTYPSKRDYAYYRGIFGNRPMPFAFLDLDLLEQNIRQIVARAQGKRVRLASKSLRSVAVIRR